MDLSAFPSFLSRSKRISDQKILFSLSSMNYRTRVRIFIEELRCFTYDVSIKFKTRDTVTYGIKIILSKLVKMSHISQRQLHTLVDVRPLMMSYNPTCENIVKIFQHVTHLAMSTAHVSKRSISNDTVQSGVVRTLSKLIKTSHISQHQLPTSIVI